MVWIVSFLTTTPYPLDLFFNPDTTTVDGNSRPVFDMAHNLKLFAITNKNTADSSSLAIKVFLGDLAGYSPSCLKKLQVKGINAQPTYVASAMDVFTTSDNITHFTVIQGTILPEILRSLGHFLPNLTTLAYFSCKFIFDENHNVLLDLKDYDNLEILTLAGLDSLDIKEDKSIFIQIKWPTSDNYVCHQLEKGQQVMVMANVCSKRYRIYLPT